MRKFIMLSPNFWIGSTGRDLRAAGTEAQLLAVYLISNPLTNYTGLYRLPLIYIANDLGLTVDATRDALAAVEKTGFARYDEKTEYVWIVEAARHQLGEELKASDNKVKFVNKEFAALAKGCPFIADYYAKYAGALHLKARAEVAAIVAAVKATEPEPVNIAQPAPQPEAAPVVAAAPVKAPAVSLEEVLASAGIEVKTVNPRCNTAQDALDELLTLHAACGYSPESAKKVAAKVHRFINEHGDYCARKLIERASAVDDYEMLDSDMYEREVLAMFDI